MRRELLRAHGVSWSAWPATCGCSPACCSGRLPGARPERPSLAAAAFPGRDAQRQAWDHGVKVSGATVHLVDEGLDCRPIVLQEAVPVLEDTAEDLAARILEAEHRIYPRAVRLLLGPLPGSRAAVRVDA